MRVPDQQRQLIYRMVDQGPAAAEKLVSIYHGRIKFLIDADRTVAGGGSYGGARTAVVESPAESGTR